MADNILLGQELITEFLTAIQAEMVGYLDANDRNATGRSRASIQVVNVTQSSGQLIGSDSIEYTFTGRGAGKMPPINALIDWCNARGLPRSMAWAVAKIIAESGTRLYRSGERPLEKIITEERIEKFKSDLIKIYTAQIQTQLNSILAA
jgi:hypothetical protein